MTIIIPCSFPTKDKEPEGFPPAPVAASSWGNEKAGWDFSVRPGFVVFDVVALQRLHFYPGRRPEKKAEPKVKAIGVEEADRFHWHILKHGLGTVVKG
jgi:hypothetical protein